MKVVSIHRNGRCAAKTGGLTARTSSLSRRRADLPDLLQAPSVPSVVRMKCPCLTRRNDGITDDHDPSEALLLSYSRHCRPFHVFSTLFLDVSSEAIFEEQETSCLSEYCSCDCDSDGDAEWVHETHDELHYFVSEQWREG